MDQFAALHWIQENIAEFGGDPKSVTVFGQGHGAACVNFLVLSPMAKGLFHRAIMQSGSALSPWAIAQDATNYAQQLARTLGCPASQSAAFLECMRQRSVSDILRVRVSIPDFLTGFGPTVDGIVIQSEPLVMMKELNEDPQYGSFDLIFGVTRVESYFHVSSHESIHGIDTERRDRLLRTLVRNVFSYHLQEIFLTIVNEYTDWTRSTQHAVSVLDGSLDAIGDALVVAPVIKASSYHSIGQHKSYFYVFGYQTVDGDFPQRQGCVQGEEMPYIFGAPLVDSLSHFTRNYSKAEAGLAEAVMRNWVNFAKNGDPNAQESDTSQERTREKFDKIVWPQYETVHQKYLMIGMKPKVRDHYHAHRLSFWINLFPQLHNSGTVGASSEHHFLDDHNNKNTYDGVVRQIPAVTTGRPSKAPPVPLMSTGSTTSTPYNNSSRRNMMHTGDKSPPAKEVNRTDSLAVVMQNGAFTTALSVTIAVGCSLLVLNILIFAGIYHQRSRSRREEKHKKRNYGRSNDGQLLGFPNEPMKQIPLRAPPPSPVCHTVQQQQDISLHPVLHHQYPPPNLLPHKLTLKPCIVPTPPQLKENNCCKPESQPLLVEHTNKAQEMAHQQQDIKL